MEDSPAPGMTHAQFRAALAAHCREIARKGGAASVRSRTARETPEQTRARMKKMSLAAAAARRAKAARAPRQK